VTADVEVPAVVFGLELEVATVEPDVVDPVGMSGLELEVSSDVEVFVVFVGSELEAVAVEPEVVDPVGMSGLELEVSEPVEPGTLGRELEDPCDVSDVEVPPEDPP
jgi:hypothetical protein